MAESLQRVRSPEEMGLSGKAVTEFSKAYRNLGIHSLAAVREGKVYALAMKPWEVDSPHTLFSLSKSFCSMAAGFAVNEGLLRYDDSVAEVLQDSLDKDYDKRLHEVTLHHLLSMSSGLDVKSDIGVRSGRDWAAAALKHNVVHDPGTHFHYNTMGTYLAGRMVASRTGMSLRDYLMPRLFEKIGIPKPQWDCCPLGYNTGGFGLHLSVMDLARTAQLLLDNGVWGGKQLLPLAYLDRATVKQIDNANPADPKAHPDWTSGYGYQFWMARNGRFRGDGMYGQVMMMDRENNLAVCCTAGTNLMGDELDALHRLMDGLLTLPKQEGEALSELRRMEKVLAVEMPADQGGQLFGEGTYAGKNGISLRLETPDEQTLRLILREKGQAHPLYMTFGRKADYIGEFVSGASGERPQAYLGRFGVKNSVMTAQAVMPQAPYHIHLEIEGEKDGLLVRADCVGPRSGTFHLRRTDHQ